MKNNEYWALYNDSHLWTVSKVQGVLKKEAEEATGEPWAKSKKYFKIVMVSIEPIKR
tara:strand:- start:18 stop:188 length:171 start_codon:yes stop_codon:yes gene_type:complete